jgi:hypothetical protein
MKNFQIKLWPELINYQPALSPLQKVNPQKENDLDIDLRNVCEVDTCGTTIALVNLLKIVKSLPENKNRKWNLAKPLDNGVNEKLLKLGFYKILTEYINGWQLHADIPKLHIDSEIIEQTKEKKTNILFPIKKLEFSKYPADRRLLFEEFKDQLLSELEPIEREYYFQLNNFVVIIGEMAKNIADHTDENGFWGIEYDFFSEQAVTLKFVFGDLGVGILETMSNNKTRNIKSSKKHLSITDYYHAALSHGVSSKSGNKGLGMSLILGLSREMNIRLSVFDAKSRGLMHLINRVTHAEIRKIFYNIGNDTGFYYYGEITLKKRK